MSVDTVQECVVYGCHGVMTVVAYDKERTTREWTCDKGAHVFIELKPGTKRKGA